MTFECVGANKRFRPLLQHSLDAIAKRIRKEEAFSKRTRSERAACSGERLVASCGLSWPLPCRVPAKMRLVHALSGSGPNGKLAAAALSSAVASVRASVRVSNDLMTSYRSQKPSEVVVLHRTPSEAVRSSQSPPEAPDDVRR